MSWRSIFSTLYSHITSHKIGLLPYPNKPKQISVGDVIRCQRFEYGLLWAHGELAVAWSDVRYIEYHVSHGNGQLANDPTRATAPFLVYSITLEHGEGPDDIAPGEHRLSRKVVCIRLSQEYALSLHNEQIVFNLDEPMSMIRPEEDTIDILGYTPLPVMWHDR